MIEDFIRTGKLSDRELSVTLREVETYKKNAFTASLYTSSSKGLNGKKESIGVINESVRKSKIYFPKPQEAHRTFNILQSLIIQEYAGKKLDVAQISEIQFVHYPLGGKFNWHHDMIDKSNYAEKVRGLTFSMNLSDSSEYDGGNLTLKVSEEKTMSLGREKGSWIIFPSFLLHNVDEVTRGSRDAIVVWSYLSKQEIKSMR